MVKISIFRQNFYFLPKFRLFAKISIFRRNFDFCPKRRFRPLIGHRSPYLIISNFSQLKILDKTSLDEPDDCLQPALQKSVEREAQKQIEILERELAGLRLKREERETRRFKKRQQEAHEITKKYFPEGEKPPDVPDITDDMLNTVKAIWARGANVLIRETTRGHECRKADAQTLIGKPVFFFENFLSNQSLF